MAAYAHCLGGAPALFEEVEVGVLYERFACAKSPASRVRNYLTWLKEKRYLARLVRHYGACTVVSEAERRLLLRAVPRLPVTEVIPNCVRLDDYAGISSVPHPGRLIFTGPFRYHPNHEAMGWFLREVYPSICAEVPGVHLWITGDNAGFPLPPAPNVTLTGRVDDVRPLVASAWASIAPIFTGGGTRLKILESMALCTPVVATAKGAEGLDVEPGRHLLVADTPASFAGAVVRILKDPSLRSTLACDAFKLLSEKYEWNVVAPRFLGLAERVAR
jgi:glycosyltransferase involved in cell wall biosynthesis